MDNTEEESHTGSKQDEEEHRSNQEDEVTLIYLKWQHELTGFKFTEQLVILYHSILRALVQDVLFVLISNN
jgi:hypothetical protein